MNPALARGMLVAAFVVTFAITSRPDAASPAGESAAPARVAAPPAVRPLRELAAIPPRTAAAHRKRRASLRPHRVRPRAPRPARMARPAVTPGPAAMTSPSATPVPAAATPPAASPAPAATTPPAASPVPARPAPAPTTRAKPAPRAGFDSSGGFESGG